MSRIFNFGLTRPLQFGEVSIHVTSSYITEIRIIRSSSSISRGKAIQAWLAEN